MIAPPIVGRVSMNLTIVDVTAMPCVQVGDEAILLGEGVTAEDHAGLAKTIPYEILCGMKAQPLLVPDSFVSGWLVFSSLFRITSIDPPWTTMENSTTE